MEVSINITPEELGLTEKDMKDMEKKGLAKRARGGWLIYDPVQAERVKAALYAKLKEEGR